MLERRSTQRHDDGTQHKQSNAALKRYLVENGVRIPARVSIELRFGCIQHSPSIVLEAFFNPKPVPKSNGARQA